ncbi:YitT family protein, partial [uncultured Megasphaera sp.]|uniref:YczE/YyaS/YitT family protein n=1 Tax=uncultured Megasphaera sp. TaxID=165188 RepID=UPI0025E60143
MNHLKIRISVFLCSILTTAFGIDLITVASLGTSPISSVPLVVSFYTPWTFGQLTFVLNMAFIILQMALLRRQFRPVELFQIAINFVFSAALDFFMYAMAGLQGLSWPLAAVLLVAGCATLAFGICIEVVSQVLMVPGDGAVKAIAQTG